MRRNIILLLVALSISLPLGSAIPAGQALSEPAAGELPSVSDEAAFAPGRILVKVKESAPADAIVAVNRKNDARLKEKIPHSRVSVVDLPKGLSVAKAVERYEAAPEVEYAEPDYLFYPEVTPDDLHYPKLGDLDNTQQYGGTIDCDIDAPQAWDITTGDTDTVVAVIDTGVDVNHPDLKDNIWVNPDERPGNGKDDDNNGYVDDVKGWDFVKEDNTVFDSATADDHGTHVAGTIAAEGNNSIGIAGVSWQARIMPLKFIGSSGRGSLSDVLEAINYAVHEEVKISNHSWGGDGYSQLLRDAIDEAGAAGHLFVASAGNGGTDEVGDDSDATPHYPSGYTSPNIISVAASDHHDNLAWFSNYGSTSVDLAAPGRWIYSTLPENAYDYYRGTSMATPHVTGTAALIKSEFPNLDDQEIKTRILESVDHRSSLQGKMVSGGRLNTARALGVNVPPPPSTVPRIDKVQPASRVKDRTPTMSASVWDAETDLVSANIKAVYLDGRRIAEFSYSAATDKLTFPPNRKLSYAWHRVKVVAEDPQGLSKVHKWRFKVIR